MKTILIAALIGSLLTACDNPQTRSENVAVEKEAARKASLEASKDRDEKLRLETQAMVAGYNQIEQEKALERSKMRQAFELEHKQAMDDATKGTVPEPKPAGNPFESSGPMGNPFK